VALHGAHGQLYRVQGRTALTQWLQRRLDGGTAGRDSLGVFVGYNVPGPGVNDKSNWHDGSCYQFIAAYRQRLIMAYPAAGCDPFPGCKSLIFGDVQIPK
jgi:hypothetical protein